MQWLQQFYLLISDRYNYYYCTVSQKKRATFDLL